MPAAFFAESVPYIREHKTKKIQLSLSLKSQELFDLFLTCDMTQKHAQVCVCRVRARIELWLPLLNRNVPNVFPVSVEEVYIAIRTWISRWLRWKAVVFDRWCV